MGNCYQCEAPNTLLDIRILFPKILGNNSLQILQYITKVIQRIPFMFSSSGMHIKRRLVVDHDTKKKSANNCNQPNVQPDVQPSIQPNVRPKIQPTHLDECHLRQAGRQSQQWSLVNIGRKEMK